MLITNYITSAWRNILRHKLFSVINIMGLSMGLSVYIFANLLVEYEENHDNFFKNYDSIYTIGLTIRPEANAGINEMNAVPTAVLPFIKEEIPEIEFAARTYLDEFLFTIGDNKYYQKVRFADADFLKIFDFQYIYGDRSALTNPSGMVLTEGTASRFFGDSNPIGKTISVGQESDFTISAVIKDPPGNTHLKSYLFEDAPFEVILPMTAMNGITNIDPDHFWDELHPMNQTYIILPGTMDRVTLDQRLDTIFQNHFNDEQKQFASGIFSRPLGEANLSNWRLIDLPVMNALELLGILVLIIACVNYTNLAIAQSMKRVREIGLRKVLGASKPQLWFQFIVESTVIAMIALAVAISIIEFVIPLFNTVTGKSLTLNYIETSPWLMGTVLLVGLLSGSYPAYTIGKTNPTETLRATGIKGRSTVWIRGSMIGLQYTISVFMLALSLVVMSQNKQIEQNSHIFAKERTYTLTGLDVPDIRDRHELLRNEIHSIPGVESFSLSSQVPYEGTQHLIPASTVNNDFSNSFSINLLYMDHEFSTTYDLKQLSGRALTTNDQSNIDSLHHNVIINERAAKTLGFESPESAVGREFYSPIDAESYLTFNIIGLVEDKNILGLHNDIKPFVMLSAPDGYIDASIKLSSHAPADIVRQIDEAWQRVIPDYPMQGRYLTDTFNDLFGLFEAASLSLIVFALFAFILALIGLYGLSAFMAEQRIKEIGIRKVHGANSPQVVHLLVWQFSLPVIWSLPFALGLAFIASNLYLDFFADRIPLPIGNLLLAAMIGLVLSWAAVAGNSYAVARQNPIKALRYE